MRSAAQQKGRVSMNEIITGGQTYKQKLTKLQSGPTESTVGGYDPTKRYTHHIVHVMSVCLLYVQVSIILCTPSPILEIISKSVLSTW